MIPKNQILIKYTSGNELVTKITNISYQGYYYEINNKIYAGKEFTYNAEELIPIAQSNQLLKNNTSVIKYSLLTGTTSQQLSTPPITNLPSKTTTELARFFCKKLNNVPILIKEIDEQTYFSLQKNNLYQTVYTGTYNNKTQTLDQAEKQMPGIKAFLQG